MSDSPDTWKPGRTEQEFPLQCPSCQAGLEATLSQGASRVKCSQCGHTFRVRIEPNQRRAPQKRDAAPEWNPTSEKRPRPAAQPSSAGQALPPGWTVEGRSSKTGKSSYKVFRGPAGESTQSLVMAWRVANGEAAPGRNKKGAAAKAKGTAEGGEAIDLTSESSAPVASARAQAATDSSGDEEEANAIREAQAAELARQAAEATG